MSVTRQSAPALRDITRMVAAVEVRSATSYLLNGRETLISGGKADELVMITTLSNVFYSGFYCRPAPGRTQMIDLGAGQDLGPALSRANCGVGAWESGWTVCGVEVDGRIAVRRNGLTVYATPGHFRSCTGALSLGEVGRLRLGKELFEASPGFYMALGDCDQGDSRDDVITVRMYWSLRSEGAVPFIEAVTRVLNRAKAPFRAKTLSHRWAYARADAAVIYIEKQKYLEVFLELARLHGTLRGFLRESSPLFTKEIARGVGLAENPRTGESFGQHRCRLVALGVWRAFTRGQMRRSARCAHVLDAFQEAGLDPLRPYLGAATAMDDYPRLDEVRL